MTSSWDESYLGRLRAMAGDEQILIAVGARCVLRDEAGRVLLIKRADNGRWGLPGGTIELNETVRECAVREVLEETGLMVRALTPFGLYSRLSDWGPDMYGHLYHHITLACRADAYDGVLVRETDESVDAAFYPVEALPKDLMPSVELTCRDLAAFEAGGSFILQ